MTVGIWISVPQMAELACISRRAALKAATACAGGNQWRGTRLLVRQGTGRGGRSGVRYEVALSSLSEALQAAFSGVTEDDDYNVPACLDATRKPMASAPQGETIQAKLAAIGPALAHPPGSAERAAAIRAAVRPGRSLRSLQRWMADYEAGDLTALAHKRPSNAGERRVNVSREFDKAYIAAGHDEAQLPYWGERHDQLLRDMWASPAQRGKWRRVQLEAQTSLRRELIDAGINLPKSAVAISQRAVMADQHFREVDVFKHDQKTWDNRKTRIRRDQTKWKPLEEVVLNVKHLDVVAKRPDGSEVYPKMIGFLDSGTKRMFVWFVFLGKARASGKSTSSPRSSPWCDPEWGLPQRIYMDNGSENLKLATVEPLLAMISAAGLKTIVKAKPYSGASKPIESRFAYLDQHVFSMMDGYVGPLRTNVKSHQLGRKTQPYAAGYERFEEEARFRIADLEDQPVLSGPQAGRSPRDAFLAHKHVPVTVDELALDAHFAEFITRRVDRGAVSINGTRYRHPDMPNGRTVTVALSYRRNAAPLFKRPGADWAYLEAEMLFDPREIDGALAASRAQSTDRRRVRDMRKEARQPDLNGNMRFRAEERVTRLPTAAAENPIMHVIASQPAREMAAARTDGEQLRLAAPSAAEQRVARRMAETEELERYLASKRA